MPQTPPDPPSGEPSGDVSGELVVVARFGEADTAQNALGRLQADGLEAFLADESADEAPWNPADGTGGIRLMVPASQAGRAVDLLEARRPGDGKPEPA